MWISNSHLFFQIWILIVLLHYIWETSRNKLLKKHSVSKIVLTFHCSNKLFKWSQNVCKFSTFSLEFQNFFSITRIFFLTVGQKIFGNKIPLPKLYILSLFFQSMDFSCRSISDIMFIFAQIWNNYRVGTGYINRQIFTIHIILHFILAYFLKTRNFFFWI